MNASTDCNISLKTPEQIEATVVKFTNVIQDAEWISTKQPEFERKFNSFPKHIMQLIKHKRKQKYIWQKQKTLHNKKELNAITKEVKQSILKHCNNEFHAYLSNLSFHDYINYSLWKATKKLKRPVVSLSLIPTETGLKVHSKNSTHYRTPI